MSTGRIWRLASITSALALAAACEGEASHRPGPPTAADQSHTIDNTVADAVDDGMLTAKIQAALIAEPQTSAMEISVDSKDGVVQLTGTVGSNEEKVKAADVARAIQGVKDVQNHLEVKPK